MLTTASRSLSVLLIDKENKLGKKIYATGNGKCNFTNAYMKKE
ncbi:MAG: NAD(P)/FAD-dependent oxidoreductase, partial [Firmicutes bacterium]|nr:NAD(P)/FAD-dependent oxidoreductase [Bacillota bacterium]